MPLIHLAFFVAEIGGLQAEESLRRVQEIRIALAPSGDKGDSHRQAEREWADKARRADREAQQERPKMTREEYDAALAMVGVARREWVINDG